MHKFHIPGVLIGPDVSAQHYDKVASQIDLLPTLLHYVGLTVTHPMMGRNLLTLPEWEPGRSFMQHGMNYGYMVGETLALLKPSLPPQAFHYDSKSHRLTPAALPLDMARDALAHALLLSHLYETRRYRSE